MTDKKHLKCNSENECRAQQLENLMEKQVKTRRHLEEYSDISSSPSNIMHAKELQRERQTEIDHLKDILAKDQTGGCQKENTEKRLISTEGYLNNNADHMDMDTFRNTKAKQERRKEQLDSMK